MPYQCISNIDHSKSTLVCCVTADKTLHRQRNSIVSLLLRISWAGIQPYSSAADMIGATTILLQNVPWYTRLTTDHSGSTEIFPCIDRSDRFDSDKETLQHLLMSRPKQENWNCKLRSWGQPIQYPTNALRVPLSRYCKLQHYTSMYTVSQKKLPPLNSL